MAEVVLSVEKKNVKKRRNRLTTESYIKRAKEAHGDRYDYSKTEYVHHREDLIIICKNHGEFKQLPSNHLAGQNCPKCSILKKRNSVDDFIRKARKVHGDRYDYSQVRYENNKTDIEIICKEHGSFYQAPTNHLSGQNCPHCQLAKNTKDNNYFILKSRKVHGDRYDYSQIEYVNCRTKIKIICKDHGAFYQTPNNHYMGHNCPSCAIIDVSKKIKGKYREKNNY